MKPKTPLLPYTRELHTGSTQWGYRFGGLLGHRAWITCNKQRVDLRPMGFPKPYLILPGGGGGTLIFMLHLLRRREGWAAQEAAGNARLAEVLNRITEAE